MCFGNDKLSKTLLEHSLKSTVSELPLRVNILRVQITCEIDRRALSSYFCIASRRIDLEDIFFRET